MVGPHGDRARRGRRHRPFPRLPDPLASGLRRLPLERPGPGGGDQRATPGGRQKVDSLSQSYDTALQKVQQLNAALAETRAAITKDQQRVAVDQRNLRRDTLDAYTTDGGSSGFQSMFGGGGEKAVVTNEYRSVASGNISNAVDALNVAETQLTAQQGQLQATQCQANAALAQASSSPQQAEATMVAQEATLAKVKGQIATLVAQQQAAEQAAQSAAFQKRVARQRGRRRSRPADPTGSRPTVRVTPRPPQHRLCPLFRPPVGRPRRWPRPRARSACPTSGAGRRPASASTARA